MPVSVSSYWYQFPLIDTSSFTARYEMSIAHTTERKRVVGCCGTCGSQTQKRNKLLLQQIMKLKERKILLLLVFLCRFILCDHRCSPDFCWFVLPSVEWNERSKIFFHFRLRYSRMWKCSEWKRGTRKTADERCRKMWNECVDAQSRHRVNKWQMTS